MNAKRVLLGTVLLAVVGLLYSTVRANGPATQPESATQPEAATPSE